MKLREKETMHVFWKRMAAGMFLAFLLLAGVIRPEAAAAKVKLNKTKATIYTSVTTTVQLKATVSGSGSKVTWKSSNKKVATVSSSGKVTAKKAGKVTITARVGSASAKCVVTVKTRNTSKINSLYKEFLSKTYVTIGENSSKKTVNLQNCYFTVADINRDGINELLLRDSKTESGNMTTNYIFTIKSGKVQYAGAVWNIGDAPLLSSYGGIYSTWYAAGCAHFYMYSLKAGKTYMKVDLTRYSDADKTTYYCETSSGRVTLSKSKYETTLKKYTNSLTKGKAFRKNSSANRRKMFG